MTQSLVSPFDGVFTVSEKYGAWQGQRLEVFKQVCVDSSCVGELAPTGSVRFGKVVINYFVILGIIELSSRVRLVAFIDTSETKFLLKN